jgi:hypothetical protein
MLPLNPRPENYIFLLAVSRQLCEASLLLEHVYFLEHVYSRVRHLQKERENAPIGLSN